MKTSKLKPTKAASESRKAVDEKNIARSKAKAKQHERATNAIERTRVKASKAMTKAPNKQAICPFPVARHARIYACECRTRPSPSTR